MFAKPVPMVLDFQVLLLHVLHAQEILYTYKTMFVLLHVLEVYTPQEDQVLTPNNAEAVQMHKEYSVVVLIWLHAEIVKVENLLKIIYV